MILTKIKRISTATILALAAMLWASTATAGKPPSAVRTLRSSILAVDFLTANHGYAVVQPSALNARSELYRTMDGGAHWSMVTSHLPVSNAGDKAHPIPAQDIEGLSFYNMRHGALIIRVGAGACQAEWQVFSTLNGGRAWHSAGLIRGEDGRASLAIIRGGQPWMLEGSCSGRYATWYTGGVADWRQTAQFSPTAAQDRMVLSPSAVALRRFSATQARADVAYYSAVAPYSSTSLILSYVTNNGGRHWDSHVMGLSGLKGPVNALGFATTSDRSPGLAITQERNASQCLFWTEGGKRWVRVPSVTLASDVGSGAFDQVEWVNSSTAYVRAGNALWRTADGGHTWARVVGLPKAYPIQPFKGNAGRSMACIHRAKAPGRVVDCWVGEVDGHEFTFITWNNGNVQGYTLMYKGHAYEGTDGPYFAYEFSGSYVCWNAQAGAAGGAVDLVTGHHVNPAFGGRQAKVFDSTCVPPLLAYQAGYVLGLRSRWNVPPPGFGG